MAARMTAQLEKKGRVVRRREGIPVKTPELTERRRIIRPFFSKFRQALKDFDFFLRVDYNCSGTSIKEGMDTKCITTYLKQ